MHQTTSQDEFDWSNLSVSYVEPGTAAETRQGFALLVDPQGRIVASSYPDSYPLGAATDRLLPEEADLIRNALDGKSDGDMVETSLGTDAAVVETVWNRENEPIGAVYVQSPAGGPPNTNLVTEVASVVIPSGMLWLCLMLPIGLVFGVLTTRGQIRRIERLVRATAQFKDGDTAQRVPVSRPDEIGQLEMQFNQMAEQLIESFAQRQALVEQSARREERARERARIEQEMNSARFIQRSLLPEQIPAIPGWEINSSYHPAREVGGDLYDFMTLPGGRMGIIIGDATGKGVPSAIIMASAVAMLRAAAQGEPSPGRVLALVNNLLQRHISRGTFATCFFATLDTSSGSLRYANAGHNIPYLLRDGQVIDLRAIGMPLGLMPDQEYEEQEATLLSGDRLLFYTDGLVEAHNTAGDMFGEPRLKQLMQQHPEAEGLIAYLLHHLRQFAGPDWEQEDDVTLVVLKRSER